MSQRHDDEAALRATALQTASAIFAARRREEEARARLAAVVASSEDAIVTKSLDGVIQSWNQGAERIFGYRAEEIIGKSILLLIPPERHQEEVEIIDKLKRGERVDHFETVRIRKDGTPLDISLSISLLRDSSGALIGASKIARDITGQKRMERMLREERRLLELLNKTGITIASTLELQTLVQEVTDAAVQLSGAAFGAFSYTVVNEEGESLSLYTLSGAPREAFGKFPMPRNTPIFGPTFRGDGLVRSDDITKDPRYGRMEPHREKPEGRLPVRSYLAAPVISRSGEVIGGLFLGHPETGVFQERSELVIEAVAAQAAVAIDNARLYEDLRRAAREREQLLDAERMARAEAERVSFLKDEFLATLSHELRTPLSAILGWAQVLKTRPGDAEAITEGLEVIERNTRVQAQLIEDLLDMSRIVSGKIRLDVQEVDLHTVIRSAAASAQVTAEAKDIRLQLALDPVAGPVRGDPGRLQQCLWNLLSNAIKFTPKGGRVQITLSRIESHVEIAVSDTGQGIHPDFLPHLFERFRQADSSTTRQHGGLGLGLSIVKHLVEQHGGEVRASSDGVGTGATFRIELPLMVVHEPREHPRADDGEGSPGDHPSLRGIRVLVVDDERDARRLLTRVLEDCGAEVVVAASAAEAFSLLEDELPDVIICDIGMPGEDGYQLIARVRRLSADKGGRIPAAALTAFARAEDRTRALLAGFQTHVSKPVEPRELTAVVASLALRP